MQRKVKKCLKNELHTIFLSKSVSETILTLLNGK